MNADDLAELHAELRSDKVTRRKAALRVLEQHLGSADLARLLDETTASMDAGRGGDIKSTWAGLCGSLMLCVAAELDAASGKRAPANKTVVAILRRFVAAAEDAKRKARSGVVAPLRRRAGKLFTHVLEVLRDGPAEFHSEYTQMLRAHLLPERAYCARAKANTYEGVVAVYKDRLERLLGGGDDDGEGAGGADDANRSAQTLLQLLKSCPHDLSPRGALPDVASFLGRSLARLAGEEGRLPAAVASALNVCLARGGLDLAPTTTLASLCRDVEPFVTRALAGAGANTGGPRAARGKSRGEDGEDTRVSDAAVTLCRLLLALGGLRACPGAIDRIASSVEMAIAARSADGTGGGHRGGYRGAPGLTGIPGDAADFALTHSHAAACALAADLFVEQCVHPGADGGWRREALFPAECDPDADACPGAGTRRPRDDADPDATGDGILARANRRRRVAEGVIYDASEVIHDADDRAASGRDDGSSARRTEPTPALLRVGALAAGPGAAAWGPVACVLLTRHGERLPPALTRHWLERLAPALAALFAAAAGADRSVAARLAWVARCLRELCGAERRRRRHGASPSASGGTRDRAIALETEDESGDTSGTWSEVRRCVARWLPNVASHPSLTAEALLLLSAVSSSDLAPPTPAPAKFWKLRALSTSTEDEHGARCPPSMAALEATAAMARGGAGPGDPSRKRGWYAARVGWILLRLQPPPAGERISFYHRRDGTVDSGAGPAVAAAVAAAMRSVLLGTPPGTGPGFGARGARRADFPDGGDREWWERSTFGSDEWALEEELRALDARAAPRLTVRDDADEEDVFHGAEIGGEIGTPGGPGDGPGRRGGGAGVDGNAGDAGNGPAALVEGAGVFREMLQLAPRAGPVSALRLATTATTAAAAAANAGRVGARSAAGPDPWGRDGAVVVSTAEAIVAAAASLREASATMFRGDVPGSTPGDAASNLAALDDVAQLAATLPGAAAAGLLDERGNGTLHDAVSYLITAVAAVASDAAEASMAPPRGVGSGGAGSGGGGGGDDMFDEDLDAFPSVGGTAGGTGVSTQTVAMTQAVGTPFLTQGGGSARTLGLGSAFASGDGILGATVAGVPRASDETSEDATARAAVHALSALGETFPAAAAAVLESLLALVTEPVEVEAGAEAGEAGEGAVDVKPGAERAADAIVGALCALSGVDAGDETLADGSRAVGVAELAEATVAGLEAAFVGPGGSGEDAATGGAPENRRAWLLAQTAALAEGLLRRRRLRNRPRVDDARARAAARRGGYPPRDAAALAAESTETAALYPRLRYLIEDIAGLTDCVALENAGVTDASRFAPGALRLPHSRAVFSRALRACLELDPEFFQPPLAGALVALLQDSSGVVRRAAGRDIARVLTVFEPDAQPRVMRERILPRLALAAALADEDAPGPSASADDDADGAGVGGGGGLRSAADVALAAEAARRARVEDEEMEDADAPGNGATARGNGATARGNGATARGNAATERGNPNGGDVHPMFRSPLGGGAAAAASAAACVEETAMCTLGHLAAASPAVESRCVFLLVAHAARTSAVGEENSRGETRASVVAKAADILTRLARAMGYPTRREYVARHARVIGALWMRAGISARRLLAVPELVASLGDGDAIRLAKEWSRVLLPPAVLAANAGAVRALAEACGETRATILRENVARIFAQLFVLSRCETEPRRRLASAAAAALKGPLLAEAADGGSPDALYLRHLADVASEMTLLAHPSPRDAVFAAGAAADDATTLALAPPYHSPAEIVRAGRALPRVVCRMPDRRVSAGDARADADRRSMWTGDRAFRCLSNLHAESDAATHPRHRLRALAGVGVMLELLGDEAWTPSTWRQLCHLVLPHVGDAALGVRATRLLESITGPPAAAGDWSGAGGGADGLGAEALADTLQPIASTLVAAAEGEGPSAEAAARALTDLLAGAAAAGQSPRVRAAAAALTPLPRDAPLLEAAARAHAAATRVVPMAVRLRALVERVPRLPPRLRAVATRDGLREALERSREVAEGGAAAATDAWRLASLAANSGDETQIARAGELLAFLGPHAREEGEDVEESASARSGRAALVAVASAADPDDPALAAEALRQLSGLTCDSSSAVAREASATARLVLAAQVSRAAMVKHMTPLERAYLEPLAPTTGTSLADAERDALRRAAKDSAKDSIREGFGEESADRSAATLDDPSVWIPSPDRETRRGVDAGDADRGSIEDPRRGRDEAESRRRDAWLRRVVGALLPHCESPLLRLSRRVAAAHAPLAEILLPAALADLAAHHAEGGRVHRAVSAGVAACLKSDGGECARVVRAMLSALDAVRARRVAALQRPATTKSQSRSQEKGDGRGSAGATRGTARGAADGAPASPEAWRRAYWVDVDYLVAAAAALRARVPLTAALLVETWLEDRHGTVSLDDADAAAERGRGAETLRLAGEPADSEGVPEHVRLLLEAQAGLSEPDGIYGLLRSHALPIQMRLYEHEGAWSQALAGHDAALRRAEGERASGFGGADARARLVDTLRRMGCLHVLDVYVRSLPAEEAAAPEIAEARFEAAWRAGRWDLPAEDAAAAAAAARVDADPDAGFHRGLHAALATLRAGNVAAASAGLDAIRGSLVRRATAEGAEAEETARAAVVRLRMLDDVADAARLWNAFRPGGGGAGAGAGDSAEAALDPARDAARARIASQAATSLRDAWRRRVGALGRRSYRLAEPLLALHGVILREIGDAEALAAHLAETASLARKAGEAAEGLRAIHQVRALAAGAGARWRDDGDASKEAEEGGDDAGWARYPMSSPLARWRLEEAKLLWASDRAQMAIGLGRRLMETIAPGMRDALVAADGDQRILNERLGCTAAGGSVVSARKKSTSGGGADRIALQDPSFYETMCLVSKWQGATRTESSRTILNQHIAVVHNVSQSHARNKKNELELPASSRGARPSQAQLLRLIRRTHFRLGQFSDHLYAQSEERLSSPEWAQSEKLRARNEEELASLKQERAEKRARLTRSAGSLSREEASALEEETRMLHRRIFPLEKQVLLDREETQSMLGERVRWLITALQAYRRCLEAGHAGGSGGSDQRVVFRVIAMWFSICGGVDGFARRRRGNAADDALLVSQVNDEVAKLARRASVPSRKFLVLSYQICGRLGTASQEGNVFPVVLRQLVDRMAAEHPYHTLYHVHALYRGDQVGGSGHHYSMPREKINAAGEVLHEFKSRSAHHASMTNQMERMIEAYIALARHPVESGRGSGASQSVHQIPSSCKKRSLSNLNLVPVVTASLPVDPTMRYAEGTFPSFQHFGDTCRLVGGINCPKLVEAHGSDGVAYKQLAKAGNDDLRQDAVMQQLFGVVNRTLADDPATRARRLRVGTYRVVPFTPAAGVLEWVDNTTLLSEYLLGSGGPAAVRGAHERYRPRDWKSRECRDKLAACQTREELRATYDKVCAKFKPVMHHFFLENFPNPQQWWEKRLVYTRSVAVNSMVGYVVGLGDRHSSNILLDKCSAEMIHIDLGVAFEQGKCLKTPEQVPFRLTRDVVDGMGACGVEGVMRRCSEETLRVLRANKDALTTIVAVLVHDPILKWAVSPERANQRQRDRDAADERGGEDGSGAEGGDDGGAPQEGNLDAERALMRVAQKLDGYEGSELRSIEGQVQQLLQDAQDPEKLCAMYPGWAAWV